MLCLDLYGVVITYLVGGCIVGGTGDGAGSVEFSLHFVFPGQ
jgi:hypothetical protein